MLMLRRLVYEECFSSNNMARTRLNTLNDIDGIAIMCHEQMAGKGQRGRSWYSTPYESLTMSLGLKSFWPSDRSPFSFQAAVAVMVAKTLRKETQVPATLKWPNDLYYNDSKLGGILTEAQSQGNNFWDIVVGIGINLNQIHFPPDIPNPVSLRQVTGAIFNPEQLFHKLCDIFDVQLRNLRYLDDENILSSYSELLDGFKKAYTYTHIASGISFKARLKEIQTDGRALYVSEQGQEIGPFHHHELQRHAYRA